jgi:hypothetical protein
MALLRRLFRELQLQRCMSVPRIDVEGVCDVASIFHIESGKYEGTALDGLNVALAVHAPGPMADGNWSVAAYIDQNANDEQTEALGGIFTGAAGGPMAQLAPLIGKNLGVKKVPINYRVEGKKLPLKSQTSYRRPLIHCRPRTQVERYVRIPVIRLAQISWRSLWAHREMFSPITECVGIILEKTDITRRFVGRTTRDVI